MIVFCSNANKVDDIYDKDIHSLKNYVRFQDISGLRDIDKQFDIAYLKYIFSLRLALHDNILK